MKNLITKEDLLKLQCEKIENKIYENLNKIIESKSDKYIKYKHLTLSRLSINIQVEKNCLYLKSVFKVENNYGVYTKFKQKINEEDFENNFFDLTIKMLDYILKEFTVLIYKIVKNNEEKIVDSDVFSKKISKQIIFFELTNIRLSNIIFDNEDIDKINIYDENKQKLFCSITF